MLKFWTVSRACWKFIFLTHSRIFGPACMCEKNPRFIRYHAPVLNANEPTENPQVAFVLIFCLMPQSRLNIESTF
ncbi:hypothetical protein Agabi119p4_5933 [Agaricus bisporus var. burnettii]|uniref:Uncharacterized protein n=1 Tax=Agaricus bisporus var. burnettii TaxID=192524 RepID=A0A8H7F0W3_AGABI|nr:hypothetical protein Agabi119p4_5933 [Agaricus bisporus var. burnettii]